MAFEPKPNTGSLFANKEKTQDTHASAKGSAVIDGVHYFIDAWTNVAADGVKYQSLKFKRKDKQPAATPEPVTTRIKATAFKENVDDDCPF